ncbi:hypothetical protein OCO_47550 [Mycobacterium intracellulare MOTT-02]|uniref:Uncharacterized protein n=1 Tax=Mycobacterium intracellulare (strain ATCC 13950 / DSM 43223 / JCM 6384 / NCTC 13025 / 3600) TaxID=487521 RepID=H8IW84_MYCIA|nr:hypothetical protein OCU_47490 [Mycobacterium intracellulare ATCC 13950]AFC51117.1 hypothetical protein OCO_47550 [Mycobacterium intracellulare MOTT-02]AFC56369.1 hypothetical protein OCQ_48580 [Mycobacterium paraintracellulare]ARV85337.1 hypothetical protein BWK49_26425 [Mycobacterium intracellulare subsp. chimaera]ASW88402.1 hypothetical protein CKJ61_23560 [Mycobacterium intracellulare]
MAFDRYQADRPGSYRHPKHDVHVTPPRSFERPPSEGMTGKPHPNLVTQTLPARAWPRRWTA